MQPTSVLTFDWAEVHGQSVGDVRGLPVRTFDDGSVSWWQVAFDLGQKSVVLRADAAADEITVSLEDRPDGPQPWVQIATLAHVVGEELGWCWGGTNFMGYSDVFIMSFNGIEPNYLFVGEASAISCMKITPVVGWA